MCRSCRCSRAEVKNLCRPCYAYRRKYGKPRPYRVLVAAGERVLGRLEMGRESPWPTAG